MGRKYKVETGDEWIAPRKGYRMACCDCGLVHSIDFEIGKNSKTGKMQPIFKVDRDNRATAAMRKAKRFDKIRKFLPSVKKPEPWK